MKLANQGQVTALDPEFGRMATEVGLHAWSLPHLTMREKTFIFLAADLCTANIGFALLTHVQMAQANGISVPECIAAIRHLAPYTGYPTAAVALQHLRQLGPSGPSPLEPGTHIKLPPVVLDSLDALDCDFAAFYAGQFAARWDDGSLSPRERALTCIATDVLNQTLGEPFALHVDLAVEAGAGEQQIRAVLLLVAEFGIAKAWQAYRALADRSRT